MGVLNNLVWYLILEFWKCAKIDNNNQKALMIQNLDLINV